MILVPFQEAHGVRVLRPEGKDWDVVIIEAGLSLNNVFYPSDTLRRDFKIFEGVRACAYRFGNKLGGGRDQFNHLPDVAALQKPEGFVENEVGFFRNARFGKFKRPDGHTGEGILALFHVLEGHEWLRKNLRDAWEHGRSDLMGFSIDARGQAREGMIEGKRVRIVEKIVEVRSTDVVTNPAAGGAVLRLVASVGGGAVMDATHKSIYELVEEHRPMWLLEDVAAATTDDEYKTNLMAMLEANLAKAEDVQSKIGIGKEDEQTLLEVAHGVNALNQIMGLLRAGKVNEAMRMLKSMIEGNPVHEKASVQSCMAAHYSFPYKEAAPVVVEPTPAPVLIPAPAPAAAALEEDTMDAETKAKLERLAELETQNADFEKKWQDLQIKERDLRIDARVNASDLPDAAKEKVLSLLKAREGEVTDEQVDEAVEAEKTYIGTIKETPAAASKPHGLGKAHGDETDVTVGKDKYDNLVKAWEGFFDGGIEVDGVQPFRSLHEAWGKITGKYYDRETLTDLIFESIRLAFPSRPRAAGMEGHINKLREGWGSSSAIPVTMQLREAITTSDFPVSFGDALFRRLQKEYREDPRNDWRRIISSMENLTDLTNKFNFIRIGGLGVLPDVPQNAPYQEFTDPTEVNEQLTPSKKGALFKMTWEDVLADRVGVIRRVPSMLGRSAVRTIHELVWDEIDTNPLMADGIALIDAAHNNLVATNPALSYAAVTDAITLLRNQTEQDSGKLLGLSPAFLLVGPEKENEAIEITDSTVKVNTAEDATTVSFINRIGVKTFATLGLGRVVSPTTKFRWYVAAAPRDAESIAIGFLGGRDRPDIFVQSPVDTPTAGASFDSDALTFKVRLGLGAKVLDHRWIVGSLATA